MPLSPGVDIWAAAPNGSGGYQSGTSYAVPHALSHSALYLAQNKNLGRDMIKKALTSTPAQYPCGD